MCICTPPRPQVALAYAGVHDTAAVLPVFVLDLNRAGEPPLLLDGQLQVGGRAGGLLLELSQLLMIELDGRAAAQGVVRGYGPGTFPSECPLRNRQHVVQPRPVSP
jgi:hypothetical protein